MKTCLKALWPKLLGAWLGLTTFGTMMFVLAMYFLYL